MRRVFILLRCISQLWVTLQKNIFQPTGDKVEDYMTFMEKCATAHSFQHHCFMCTILICNMRAAAMFTSQRKRHIGKCHDVIKLLASYTHKTHP